MSKQINFSNILSVLSFAIAVVAVCVSIYSVRLAKNQYVFEKSLIVTADYDSEKKQIRFSPINESMKILKCDVYFPPSFAMYVATLDKDGYFEDRGIFDVNSKYVIGRMFAGKDYNTFQFAIPIVINSYYAVDGGAYTDTSFYWLIMRTSVTDKCIYFSAVDYSQLIFIERDIKWNDIHSELEVLFEKVIQTKGIRLPVRNIKDF
jgi:hypothetical protein